MANNNEILASGFITELLAYGYERKTIFEIARQYLKYSYLHTEAEKKLWQWLTKRFDLTGKVPSIGQTQQHFIEDEAVLEKLLEIKDVDIDEEDDGAMLITTFESFIKKMKFLEVNDRIADTYNRGDKEKAWSLFVSSAEEFSKFSIRNAVYETVFGDFAVRQARRRSEDYNSRFKIPTGIDELDYRLGGDNGGPETGECVLWLGMSGAGKSQCLVHLGITAARQGYRVVHFQLEGTKEQCLNRYDAAWTGTLYQDVKLGNITAKRMEIAKKIVQKLRQSDIIVRSVEEFNAMTLTDMRRELKEIEKAYGKVDVIIWDYLELAEPGDGHNYTPGEERFRQSKLAKGAKMLAMEFNAVVHVATQTNDVPPEQRNDPEFVITRSNLNEDRGKVRPVDIFVTINQTSDERKEEIMRLHTDKLRDYANGNPIHICNNFAYARFYDRKRTIELNMENGWDDFYDKDKDEEE